MLEINESLKINSYVREGGHSLNAKEFFNNQLSFINIVFGIIKTIDPDSQVDIKVEALKEGSLDSVFHVVSNLENIFFVIDKSVTCMTHILTLIVGIITVRKLLKGRKVKNISSSKNSIKIETSGDKSSIEIETTNPEILEAVLKNTEIANNITQYAQTLKELNKYENSDRVLQGFYTKKSNEKNWKKSLEMTKMDTDILSSESLIMEKEDESKKWKILHDQVLQIKVIDLEGNQQWNVQWNGEGIKITDEDFINKIHKKEYRFASKDKIVGDIRYEVQIIDEIEERTGKYELTLFKKFFEFTDDNSNLF